MRNSDIFLFYLKTNVFVVTENMTLTSVICPVTSFHKGSCLNYLHLDCKNFEIWTEWIFSTASFHPSHPMCKFECFKLFNARPASTLGSFWQLLATFGNCWQMLGTFGNIWQPMATFGNFWHLLAIFWHLLATFGSFWLLLATSGNFNQLLLTFCYFWVFLATSGKLWQLLVICSIFSKFWFLIAFFGNLSQAFRTT